MRWAFLLILLTAIGCGGSADTKSKAGGPGAAAKPAQTTPPPPPPPPLPPPPPAALTQAEKAGMTTPSQPGGPAAPPPPPVVTDPNQSPPPAEPPPPGDPGPVPQMPPQPAPPGGVDMPRSVQPPAGQAPDGATAQQREDKRMERLRQLNDQQASLFGKFAEMQGQATQMKADVARLDAARTRAIAMGRTLQSQLAGGEREILGLQQNLGRVQDPNQRNNVNSRIQQLQSGLDQGRRQLETMRSELNRAQSEQQNAVTKLTSLNAEGAQVVQQINRVGLEWLQLCDPLGKSGPAAHERAIGELSAWIARAPRLSLPYLARGFSYVHTGKYDEALKDFDAAGKLFTPLEPLTTAAEGFALTKQGERRKAVGKLNKAVKGKQTAGLTYVFRGLSYIDAENYAEAEKDFLRAVQAAEDSPDGHQALAMLLAACPDDTVAKAAKALEHAQKACQLSQSQDWTCLDALAAAHAASGDFASAVKQAEEALRLAPADCQEAIQQRLGLYQARKPYRLRQGGAAKK